MPTTISGTVIYDEANSTLQGSTSPSATNDVVLVRLGSVSSAFGGSAAGAEGVAFENGKVYSTNLVANTIVISQVTNNPGAPASIATVGAISLSGLTNYKTVGGGGVNSVAVKDGVIAVAYENSTAGAGGYIALFDATTNTLIKTIQVGVLPDMVTFSPDGSKILVANEGERVSVSSNPAGSISIIDMSGGAASASVTNTISFSHLDGSEAALRGQGLNMLAGQTAGNDIEPEYITISPDGTRAYVTLQEVNGVAVIDLTDAGATKPIAIQPLGYVDWSLSGNKLDTSDRDGAGGTASLSLRNFDGLRGLLQPDAIASFSVGGSTYFITANEGDARVPDALTDSLRLNSASYVLDPTLFPNAATLKLDANLGRLNVLAGIGDIDNDGDYDKIYTLGGRGITIFRQNADGSITKVRETGGEFEAITAALGNNGNPAFNSNQSVAGSSFDTRSDDKGPEPEGVTIGVVNGRTYAFVGLERVGGMMVYDVTDPANATFVGYQKQAPTDLGPEVQTFVSAGNSPTGQALLISGNEISNTVTLYSVQTQSSGNDTINGGGDADTFSGRDGNDTISGFGGNDTLNGNAGLDLLIGGAGNDTIDGGIGTDTARFSGAQTDYTVTEANGIVTVVDNRGGSPDGTDTLTNVERLSFIGDSTVRSFANQQPVITSDLGGDSAALNRAENGTAVTTVVATDADADTVTYSINGGSDADKFDINASTGVLTFKVAPDFDLAGDSDGNNTYSLFVRAADQFGGSDQQLVSVTVSNQNEAPVIGSNLGGDTAAINFAENGTGAVTTVQATDPDASTTVAYSLSGTDKDFFNIDATTGALTFKNAPNFEVRADNGGNNVYDVVVTASDGTLTDTQALAIAVTNVDEAYTLQLLHLSDGEAGTLAPTTAPFLAALADRFEDQYANSITLAGGDTFLPGPFLAAGTDPALVALLNQLSGSTIAASGAAPGVVDTVIHNLIGVEATGIGNHEWDLGSSVYLSSLTGGGFTGAQYASISANLVLAPAGFAADPLNARFTQTVGMGLLANEEAQDLKGRIAPSAVINEGGQTIGLVGVTTQILESISSPTGAEIAGFPFGPGANGEINDMAALAALLQPVINDLRAQGVNKIVLLSHLQQITFEKQLAPLLNGVDIILAAGSNTRLGDANDVAASFPGHAADFADTYPLLTAGADGKPTLIVNTDNEYTYLGRLVVDFNEAGEIITSSLGANAGINGAYASTAANVAAAWNDLDGDLSDTAFATGTRGGNVKALTDAVNNVITLKDGTIYGYSNVYLEGERIQVRNQETNLGNVSADANADVARDALGLTNEHAIVSIKNGGGIRAQIGTIVNNSDGTVTKVRPEAGGEVSRLDVENALRFDNKLMVFDTTAQGLLNILNSPSALAPNNGGFIQIGGVRFSYDPTKAAGARVQDVVLVNEDGDITAVIADNGVVVAGAPSLITAIALNFTANGGDGYLVKTNADNFRFVLNDGTLSAAVDEALDFTAPANVPANAIGEQQAFAEYFQERYATPGTAYNTADTSQALDTRIQNQAARTDTVLVGDYLLADASATFAENGTGTAFQGVSTGLTGSITYSLTGADAGKFNISNTGAVTFKVAPNFESPADAGANNIYDVRVVASNVANTTEQDLLIMVGNVNERPVITSNGGDQTGSVSVVENTTAVTTLVATDVDAGDTQNYKIYGGPDAAKFAINGATGALTFIGAPDFEALGSAAGTNVYTVVVAVEDANGLNDVQTLAVTVTNVIDGTPVISSNGGGATASVALAEGQTAITTVVAGGNDVGAVTYALTGADAALFTLDATTGALTLNAAADFETPADAGLDNTYNVTVTATNVAGNTDVQDLAIAVSNVNEAPVITSNGGDATAAFMVDETVSTVAGVTATDVDAGTTLVYSISGGADAALFEIDPATGLLTFLAAPDVDAPADAGANNVYDVVVRASDGVLFDTQALAISVARLIDGSVKADKLTGTSGADNLRGFGGNDELTGLAGDDILDGGAGSDKMTGGLGNDTYIVDATSDKAIELAGQGTDTVLASAKQHRLAAQVENLTFSTGGTHSGSGNDLDNVLTGNIGNDTLRGNAGNDTLIGLEGNDNLAGGDGNDIHNGGAGNDAMSGGAGNDTYVVDATGDKVQEANGKGTDTVQSSITYTLTSNVETLNLTGSNAINGKGNGSANTITGNSADNVLNGAAGDDTLSGGLGKDTLIGGKGADTFLFASVLNGASNVDLVSDFDTGQSDQIALSKAVFAALGAVGTLSQAEFYASASATSAHDANDRIIYNTTTGNLYYDADGFGGAAAVQFATIGATVHPTLVFADFDIVA